MTTLQEKLAGVKANHARVSESIANLTTAKHRFEGAIQVLEEMIEEERVAPKPVKKKPRGG